MIGHDRHSERKGNKKGEKNQAVFSPVQYGIPFTGTNGIPSLRTLRLNLFLGNDTVYYPVAFFDGKVRLAYQDVSSSPHYRCSELSNRVNVGKFCRRKNLG